MADRELRLARLEWDARTSDQFVKLSLPTDCARIVWTSGPKYNGQQGRMDVVYVVEGP